MIIIGLTGSIGMGKTTVAAQFAAFGLPVCNADAIVHRLLGENGQAVEEVQKHFPDAVREAAVDRRALAAIVFYDTEKMRLLEGILHPLVVNQENVFLERQRGQGARAAVLEIPLLYETGAQTRCDAVVVATAPHFLQRRRVLSRPHMTQETFARILAMQMPDREKRKRADFIVQTGLGRRYSGWQVKRILEKLHVA